MSKRLAIAAFAAAVLAQIAILIAVPAQRVMTLTTGRSVFLKVQPMDPYSNFTGYYVTLTFDISGRGNFPPLETLEDGDQCYAVIEEGPDGVWKPVSLELSRPSSVPSNRVALAGRYRYGQIRYGIENFYIDERDRYSIAEDLRKHPEQVRVEVKVDRSGNTALKRMMIEDRVYE